MENNDRPVDFHRLRLHIQQIRPCQNEPALRGHRMLEIVEEKLNSPDFQAIMPTGRVFIQEVRDYFLDLAAQQTKFIQDIKGSTDNLDVMTWYTSRMTETQLNILLERALEKCLLAFVEPGEAVGAIGAQSISEPGTQMTLKVSRWLKYLYHCAFLASFS